MKWEAWQPGPGAGGTNGPPTLQDSSGDSPSLNDVSTQSLPPSTQMWLSAQGENGPISPHLTQNPFVSRAPSPATSKALMSPPTGPPRRQGVGGHWEDEQENWHTGDAQQTADNAFKINLEAFISPFILPQSTPCPPHCLLCWHIYAPCPGIYLSFCISV